jgi:folate-binding protein YgfZ
MISLDFRVVAKNIARKKRSLPLLLQRTFVSQKVGKRSKNYLTVNGFGSTWNLSCVKNNNSNFFVKQTNVSTITTLKSRRIIRVKGIDSESFLQGLTTNDISLLNNNIDNNNLQYTYFLNHKGRAICDAFVKRGVIESNKNEEESSFLIDCRSDAFPVLSKLLKVYRLRAKVKIKEEKNVNICVYGDYNRNTDHGDSNGYDNNDVKKFFDVDPRSPIFGNRGFIPNGLIDLDNNNDSDKKTNELKEMEYNYFLRLQGILEGIEMNGLIPLECNLDSINGVNFEKGCYIGQELTARTHFTGLVRKLCFPVYFKKSDDDNTADVTFPTSFTDINSSLSAFRDKGDNLSSLINFNILPDAMDEDSAKKKPINLFVDGRKVGKLILPPLAPTIKNFPPIGIALIRIDMVVPSEDGGNSNNSKKIIMKADGRIDVDENIEVIPFKPGY